MHLLSAPRRAAEQVVAREGSKGQYGACSAHTARWKERAAEALPLMALSSATVVAPERGYRIRGHQVRPYVSALAKSDFLSSARVISERNGRFARGLSAEYA